MNNKFDIHAIKIFHYFHAQEKCINTIVNIYQLRLPFYKGDPESNNYDT